MLTSHGIDMAYIRRSGIAPIILDLTLRFRKELLPRQRIRIDSWSEPGQKKIFLIRQNLILLESDEVATEILLTAGLMDMGTRKLIAPPPDWQTGLGIVWQP